MNIADRLRDSARRLPGKAALRYQGRVTSYGDLDAEVDRAVVGLRRLGLEPGDRVGLMLGNSPHFVTALYATWRAGMVAVPLNTGFTADEAVHILGDAGVRMAIVSEAHHPVLMGVSHGLGGLEEIVVAGASSPPVGAQTWQQLLSAGPEPEGRGPMVPTDADDLALLAYTSGTTGPPKGARLTHANLLANQRQMDATPLRLHEQDIVFSVLPMFHIYGLNVGLALPLARGAEILVVERFDPVATIELIAERRASVLIGAPPIYVAWANIPGIAGYDLSSVRLALSGAAPLPVAVARHFNDELGLPLSEGYGLTETSPVLTSTVMGSPAPVGSVGRPLPDVDLRVADERGRTLGDGELGEVLVRGPNVFSGYWNAPAATAEAFDADGWFRTGDIGYLSDASLYLVDRKSDLIIVSGFNVYPHEVENVIARHPKVAEVAVVGAPHPYTGESVRAVVVLRPGEEASAGEIIDFCGRWIARFKCPSVVEFAAELPRALTGKVRRAELRKSGARWRRPHPGGIKT